MKANIKSETCMHVGNLSWRAIIAGVITALSIQTLFNLLGLAIGFSAFTPAVDTVAKIGTGSVIWLALTGIISMFFGGWVASPSGLVSKGTGALHGFVAWGTTTLLIFVFAATAAGSMLTTGTISILSKGLTYQSSQTNEQQRPAFTQQNMASSSQTTARDQQGQMQPVKQTAEKAASVLAGAALASFIMFVLSALAAALGGWCGSSCRTTGQAKWNENPPLQ